MIKHIENVAEFDELVKEGKVIVNFYADWCGPCRMFGPVLEEVSEEHEDELTIVKVNVDNFGELAGRFNVRSVPTSVLYDDGKIVGMKLGFQAKGPLVRWALVDN